MLTHHDLRKLEVGKKFPASQWEALREILRRPTVGQGTATGPEGTMSYQVADGGAAGPLHLVTVTQDGGAAGSASTNCSWTYTIKDLAGTELETGLSPHKSRYANTAYTKAPDDSYGLAALVDDDWVLLVAWQEIEQTGICT